MSAARKWSERTRGSQKQDAQRNETEATRKPRASFMDMLASAGQQARPTAWPGFAQETHPIRRSKFMRGSGTLLWLWLAGLASLVAGVAAPSATLETSAIRFQLAPETGSYSILDKSAGVTWRSNPFHSRFGEVTLKVLFMIGGWIRRGYDNQHPDILPTAPECGGDTAFADCARRVMQLGYAASHRHWPDAELSQCARPPLLEGREGTGDR